MKFKIFYVLALLLVFFIACKKIYNSENKHDNEIREMPPTNIPTLSGNIDFHADQWKRLSIGYAMLLADPNMCNNYNLKIRINNLVAANNEDPIRNITVHNDVANSSFPLNVPTANSSDLYDALANRINAKTPPTTISTWNSDFFSSFNHDYGGTVLDPYFVTITIPQREFQATNGHWSLPALVCPDPEVFGYPMIAYGYSPSGGGSVNEIVISNEGIYDSLIEGGSNMLFTLQYDYDAIDEKEITNGGCEGGFTAGDNICDGHCGENEANSPSDCGDHAKNKVVFLKKFKINKDLADRLANYSQLRKHWERISQGNYDPMFSCWTMGSNGKWEGIKKVKTQKVKMKDVTRERIRNSGTKTIGSSAWVDGFERNTSDFAIVSNHYNPNLSHLYIFFAEHDAMRRQKLESNVPLSHTTTTFDSIFWRGVRGNITAGKRESLEWSTKIPQQPAASDYRLWISPNPTIWVDETLNGEDIKVYYHTLNITDEIDFALFYFKNRR